MASLQEFRSGTRLHFYLFAILNCFAHKTDGSRNQPYSAAHNGHPSCSMFERVAVVAILWVIPRFVVAHDCVQGRNERKRQVHCLLQSRRAVNLTSSQWRVMVYQVEYYVRQNFALHAETRQVGCFELGPTLRLELERYLPGSLCCQSLG